MEWFIRLAMGGIGASAQLFLRLLSTPWLHMDPRLSHCRRHGVTYVFIIHPQWIHQFHVNCNSTMDSRWIHTIPPRSPVTVGPRFTLCVHTRGSMGSIQMGWLSTHETHTTVHCCSPSIIHTYTVWDQNICDMFWVRESRLGTNIHWQVATEQWKIATISRLSIYSNYRVVSIIGMTLFRSELKQKLEYQKFRMTVTSYAGAGQVAVETEVS